MRREAKRIFIPAKFEDQIPERRKLSKLRFFKPDLLVYARRLNRSLGVAWESVTEKVRYFFLGVLLVYELIGSAYLFLFDATDADILRHVAAVRVAVLVGFLSTLLILVDVYRRDWIYIHVLFLAWQGIRICVFVGSMNGDQREIRNKRRRRRG